MIKNPKKKKRFLSYVFLRFKNSMNLSYHIGSGWWSSEIFHIDNGGLIKVVAMVVKSKRCRVANTSVRAVVDPRLYVVVAGEMIRHFSIFELIVYLLCGGEFVITRRVHFIRYGRLTCHVGLCVDLWYPLTS